MSIATVHPAFDSITTDHAAKLVRAYKDALQVQDACNPGGVARGAVHAVEAAGADMRVLGYESTRLISYHPLVVLYACKLADLAGIAGLDSLSAARFAMAYRVALWIRDADPADLVLGYHVRMMDYFAVFPDAE